MSQPRSKLPIQKKPKFVQDCSASVPVGVNQTDAQDNEQNREFMQAQSTVQSTKEREDDLRALGLKIKQHEDKLKLLKNKITKFDDNFDMIKNRQSSTSSAPKISEGESSHPNTEADIDEQILLHHANSAAGILCQMKTRHEAQAFKMPMLEDVVGVVATLANVQNDHLSTLLSEYLGVETMLAIVCKTNFGVGVLEIHNEDGSINKGFGLHGLGAAIGSALHDRFLVISLESLRPYPGKFVLDDPQRQLNILNPRLPNGQCPPGFLGFAVNMIKIDASNLFCVTPSGYGLRETLFYNLFSRLQVYRTRTEMMKALPLIIDGAVSLDGGIIRGDGVFYLGNSEEVNVRFPKLVDLDSIESQAKHMKSERGRILEDMKREQDLLDNCKLIFGTKRSDYIKFLVQNGPTPNN